MEKERGREGCHCRRGSSPLAGCQRGCHKFEKQVRTSAWTVSQVAYTGEGTRIVGVGRVYLVLLKMLKD